jgi:hypothetical protein
MTMNESKMEMKLREEPEARSAGGGIDVDTAAKL